MIISLNQNERERFADYLEEQARENDLLAAQCDKINGPAMKVHFDGPNGLQLMRERLKDEARSMRTVEKIMRAEQRRS